MVSRSEEETLRLGESLGRLLVGGETLALVGDLGTGKTTLTRGLARGLGIRDPLLVSSPTYVLEQVYDARVPIHHYDAYRLGSEEEFVALGFEERIDEGDVLVVEWAEKVGSVLPESALRIELRWVDLSAAPTHREILICGLADVWESRLAPLSLVPPNRI
jgi:tRNA threonylcarbamoyladenosine biosynthesis protein TsaE